VLTGWGLSSWEMLMPDTSVVYFNSSMSGAPTLAGVAGRLIGVTDPCLVTGFGSVTLDSLIIADNVATGTKSTGHDFAMTGTTGPVIEISGATPAGLNGRWRIASVPNSTTFTFATSGISNQTATGTIAAKRAPAGWTKAFSATNKAAYSRNAVGASAMLLRVDDTPAQYPTLIMYEAMTGIDAGAGPAPTSGSFYTAKSNISSAENRPWALIADGQAVYLFIDALIGSWRSGFFFGDFNSYKSGDAYGCALIAHAIASTNYFYLYELSGSTAALAARGYAQTGVALAINRYSHGKTGAQLGVNGSEYKNLVDNAFHAWPVEVWEGTSRARGLMPGLWNPIHDSSLPHNEIITDIPQLPGRTLIAQMLATNYRCALDLTGPWR
jgi:hypothetical protein